MTTAKELRIWAHTAKQWIAKIDDTKVAESLALAAAEMEHLADCKEIAERQFV
jgi:hypothetical protein